jgi:hypothetical protein
MRLGIRLLFAFFLINGIAAFFVLRVFMAEIKPSVQEVMENMMEDTTVCFSLADPIARVLRKTGINVMTRLMGLIKLPEVDPARGYISTHRGMGYCLDM